MPMTAAERQKKYIEKLKAENPEKFEEKRKKHLEKVKQKQKKISDLNEKEKISKRQKWKEANQKRREKKKQTPDNVDEINCLEDEDSLVLDKVLGDPLQDLKQEADWPALDEINTLDADTVNVCQESATLPEVLEFLSGSDNAVQETPEECSDMERRRKREEELHQLAVAERVWTLRTLREKHANAQQERAWQLKTLTEQHAAACLERERVQFQRDLAELQLRRARIAVAGASLKPDSAKRNTFVLVDKNKVQPQDDQS